MWLDSYGYGVDLTTVIGRSLAWATFSFLLWKTCNGWRIMTMHQGLTWITTATLSLSFWALISIVCFNLDLLKSNSSNTFCIRSWQVIINQVLLVDMSWLIHCFVCLIERSQVCAFSWRHPSWFGKWQHGVKIHTYHVATHSHTHNLLFAMIETKQHFDQWKLRLEDLWFWSRPYPRSSDDWLCIHALLPCTRNHVDMAKVWCSR